jgi:FdhE protein
VSWDARIARARTLAAGHSAASNILTFYADLADYQRSLAMSAQRARPRDSGPSAGLSDLLEFDAAAAAVPDFLVWLGQHAPAPLARAAGGDRSGHDIPWQELMRQRVGDAESGSADHDPATAFVVEAILQPFAERAARSIRDAAVRLKADTTYDRLGGEGSGSRCPICSGHPAVAALREEGQGAKRTLTCGLCLTEWDYLRVKCPACDENRFDALPVYTADAVAHVRVDACDTCRTYVKTVDLTKDGLALPLVDDLASVPLDLWAREHGYHRLHPNLLRL